MLSLNPVYVYVATVLTFEAFDSNGSVFVACCKCSAVNDGEATSHQRLVLLNLIRCDFLLSGDVTDSHVFFVLGVFHLLLKYRDYITMSIGKTIKPQLRLNSYKSLFFDSFSTELFVFIKNSAVGQLITLMYDCHKLITRRQNLSSTRVS